LSFYLLNEDWKKQLSAGTPLLRSDGTVLALSLSSEKTSLGSSSSSSSSCLKISWTPLKILTIVGIEISKCSFPQPNGILSEGARTVNLVDLEGSSVCKTRFELPSDSFTVELADPSKLFFDRCITLVLGIIFSSFFSSFMGREGVPVVLTPERPNIEKMESFYLRSELLL
jgi:hypothetical protein